MTREREANIHLHCQAAEEKRGLDDSASLIRTLILNTCESAPLWLRLQLCNVKSGACLHPP